MRACARRAWLVSLLAGCAARGPALHPRGLSEPPSTEAVLREAFAPRRVAVLIGVDAYDDPAFPDLRYAGADADALAEAFRQRDAGFDDVVVLDGPDHTTRLAVLDALRRIAATLRRDDELIVYFAGHGVRDVVLGASRRFLLPSDASATDLVGTAIEVDPLLDWLLALAPLRTGVIIDACFDGGGRSVTRPGARGVSVPEPVGPDIRTANLGPGDIEVFATTPGRPSLEDDSLRHGVYTWYLLEALGWGFSEADRDGDRVLTLWEAHDHARGAVVAHTKGVQIPEAILRTVGEADVALRGSSDLRRERDASLVYLYPTSGHPLDGATLSIDGRVRGAWPGTIPVSAGRHTVAILDPQGDLIREGRVTLDAGRAYRGDELLARVEGDHGDVGVQGVVIGVPALRPALGSLAAGVGVDLAVRVAPVRVPGLVVGGQVLITAAPGHADTPGARTWLGGGGWVGWQGGFDRFRWRVAWTVSGWWLPPTVSEVRGDPLAAPREAGWRWIGTGPRLDLGVEVSDGWTIAGRVTAEGTALQIERAEPVRFVPMILGGLGVRATF